jgi:hypothetical protein
MRFAVTDVNLTWQAVTDVNLTWQAVIDMPQLNENKKWFNGVKI